MWSAFILQLVLDGQLRVVWQEQPCTLGVVFNSETFPGSWMTSFAERDLYIEIHLLVGLLRCLI